MMRLAVAATRCCLGSAATTPSNSNTTQGGGKIVVEMLGLPKGWMHDEVVGFVESILSKAAVSGGHEREEREEEEDTATLASSKYVKRVRIPFGRKTGVVFGNPWLELTSQEAADTLKALNFDQFEDSRRRIRFQDAQRPELWLDKEEVLRRRMEQQEAEDRDALDTLELDRYLLDPDLLYSMARGRQRRRVTLSESIDVASFRVNDDSPFVKDQRKTPSPDGGEDTTGALSVDRDLGRGSPQNLALPQPYVRGRRGF